MREDGGQWIRIRDDLKGDDVKISVRCLSRMRSAPHSARTTYLYY